MLDVRTQTRPVRGFTLIELMVTLVVAAILITVAVPAFNSVIRRNRVTVARNALIGALSFARSAAVKQSRTVIMCKSADGQSCAMNGDWSQGWIIYTPAISTDNLLRVQTAFEQRVTISGNSHIEKDIHYDALGFTAGENGTWTISHENSSDKVKVIISIVGRVRIETP